MSEFPPSPNGAAGRASKSPGAVPPATVKGFYMSALVRELASHGHHLTTPSYRDFADYPVEQAIELIEETAQRLYPHERKGEAIRRVGWIIYPTLLNTIVGRVIFGSLGSDLPAIFRIAARGFEVSITRGTYEPVHIGQRDAHVRVRDFPLFPENYLAGIFEGVLARYGFSEGKVEVRARTPSDVDFYINW
ncbi:MAG TPA: DUF2378 family protein [Polyangiales bacterium]